MELIPGVMLWFGTKCKICVVFVNVWNGLWTMDEWFDKIHHYSIAIFLCIVRSIVFIIPWSDNHQQSNKEIIMNSCAFFILKYQMSIVHEDRKFLNNTPSIFLQFPISVFFDQSHAELFSGSVYLKLICLLASVNHCLLKSCLFINFCFFVLSYFVLMKIKY